MKTITIKTEIEQFQEQYPELYQQIFDLGYNLAIQNSKYNYDEEFPAEFDEGLNPHEDDHNPFNYIPEYAKPEDDSERFLAFGNWNDIYESAESLESNGYIAGNKNWRQFMDSYKNYSHDMYIAWNPTYKQFVVESDAGTIDELYPHLVSTNHNNTFNMSNIDDIPF